MKKALPLLMIFVLVLIIGGCVGNNANRQPSGRSPAVDPKPSQETVTITLYYGDNQAMYLIGEERTVDKKGQPLAELMVNELIKGPQDKGLIATIPKEARLLSLEIAEEIAYVNFSKEVQTKHSGGTAGESMTITSVVNTLTQLPEIKKVQFLVEGGKQEAIWGHAYTLEPIGPSPKMIAPQ